MTDDQNVDFGIGLFTDEKIAFVNLLDTHVMTADSQWMKVETVSIVGPMLQHWQSANIHHSRLTRFWPEF